MSPKFGLALLLLCFVLLGLGNAQRQQQKQPRYRVRGQYVGRNLGGDGGGFGATDGGVPPIDAGGVDCNQNTLAGGRRDRFKPGK